MADELKIRWWDTGATLAVVLRRLDGIDAGKYWDDAADAALEPLSNADWPDYCIALVESGQGYEYSGSIEPGLPAGAYEMLILVRSGASFTQADVQQTEQVYWDGAAVYPLAVGVGQGMAAREAAQEAACSADQARAGVSAALSHLMNVDSS